MSDQIYMDYAATTRTRPEAIRGMLPYFGRYYGNPSTIYGLGEISRKAIENAREIIASSIHAQKEEIFFTSGGTESDNWALREAAQLYKKKNPRRAPHLITTAIEHHAVLRTCEELKRTGARVTVLPADKEGIVRKERVLTSLEADTCLISVMYANNEIGTLQPIAELADIAKKYGILFHTDAVQAYGHVPIDVQKEKIDFLSASGHKFGGPKGVGFLYIRKGTGLPAFLYGGGQENSMRGGTENVPGIIGMGIAAEAAAKNLALEAEREEKLRDYMIDSIEHLIPQAKLNGSRIKRLPNNINFCFPGLEGESIAVLLDEKHICASSGSACSTGSKEPSHVLMAIGCKEKEARGALRFTIGEETTKKDIDYVCRSLAEVITYLTNRQ